MESRKTNYLPLSLIEFLCHVTFAFQVNKRHKWSLSPLILTELNNECSTIKQQKFHYDTFCCNIILTLIKESEKKYKNSKHSL